VTGLPASIVAAQCILESGWGEHTVGNNYFGIKSDGTQPYILAWTYEWENGKYIKRLCKFRKYESLLESLIDYGNFIYENPRYRQAIANKSNPVNYIYKIQYAGYATGLNYAQKVLRLAEQCNFLTISKW
jgi:flagellar protein FlgJ